MSDGAKFPEVVLFGTADKCWIGDGWHRVMAAEQIGALDIPAELRKGGRVDALKYALGANAVHGQRRSNADKRRCVEIAVKEFPKLSCRSIAEMCGVGKNLVASVRPKQVVEKATSIVTGADRKRFQRELARLRGYDSAAVVVESPADDLRGGRYRGELDAGAAWQSVLAFSMRYRVPFIFGRDRADAESIAFDFLRHFHRDRVRELESLDAERKMGEMLLAEAKAGRLATRGNTNPSGKGKGCVPQVDTGPATTADLGITRKERAEAQKLATQSSVFGG